MKLTPILVAALFAGAAIATTTTPAAAWCGGVEKTASAKNGKKAARKARQMAYAEMRKLKREYGSKVQIDELSQTCVGGSVAIDAQGNQIVGKSRCTASFGYCVNP